jgi:pilus assembly protein Flp/PilA
MMDLMRTFWKDESGQDLAEYGLLLALITVILIVIITTFGEQIQAAFQRASDAFPDA